MNTTLEVIDNLLAQLDAEPDNRVLIGIAHDALLEAGRIKEAVELEPRYWLKAKGRRPWNHQTENPSQSSNDKTWWFSHIPEDAYKNTRRKYNHWMPPELYVEGNYKANHLTKELAIAEFMGFWFALSRKCRDELWQWEPPT